MNKNDYMKQFYILLLLIFITINAGCEHCAGNRRIKYVSAHPELTVDQETLILNGRLWTGMVPAEVRASLGDPDTIQNGILDKQVIWAYKYRTQYTTHQRCFLDRVLRLDFIEGRLANWRDD